MEISKNEQGSPEWFNDRKLKLTGSKAQVIATAGKGMETYIQELIDEYNGIEKPRFSNEHTRRGNDLEPVARALYELKTGNKVDEVGFIKIDEYSGGSPDGLVGEDGLIEIKCPIDTKHFNFILEQKINTAYEWQMQFYLMATKRKWCDFISFNPNFKKSLVIKRVKVDKKKQEKLKIGLKSGIEQLLIKIKEYERN